MRRLKELSGYGDTIHPGDIVWTRYTSDRSDYDPEGPPDRIEAIWQEEEGVVVVSCRPVGVGPLEKKATGCTTFLVQGEGWKRVFRLLTPEEIRGYYASLPALKDGWHRIEGTSKSFRTLAGVPVEVRRFGRGPSPNSDIKHIAEVAGRLTGYDLILTGRYSDPDKRTMPVKHALKRKPLKVPRRQRRTVGTIELPSSDQLYLMAMARSEMILKGQG